MIKIFLSSLLLTSTMFASVCKDLNTDAKIRNFVSDTYKSHPLLRENISTTLDIKTNDKGTKKKQTVHTVRLKENKRSYFIKGEHAPKCSVTKSDRDFICSECTYTSNTLCRSFKGDDSSTKLTGTNIDTNDFKLLDSPDYVSSCQAVKKKANYVKITSKRIAGNSPYTKIVSYYDLSKKISIKSNYYADGILKKIYQFFPKYFSKVKGQWLAMVSRVRTVNGDAKKFSFETLISVKKSANKDYLLFLSPTEDTKVSKRIKTLFNTNQ